MALPPKSILSAQILALVKKQKQLKSDANPEQSFSDGLAEIIENYIKSASVVGVQTIVTGSSPSGPIAGNGIQNNIGKLQ